MMHFNKAISGTLVFPFPMAQLPLFAQQEIDITAEYVNVYTGSGPNSVGDRVLAVNSRAIRPRALIKIPIVDMTHAQEVLTQANFTPGTYNGVVVSATQIFLPKGGYHIIVSFHIDVDTSYTRLNVADLTPAPLEQQDGSCTTLIQAGVARGYRQTYFQECPVDCTLELRIENTGSATTHVTNGQVSIYSAL